MLKDQNTKLKECGKNLLEKIRQRRDVYRDLDENNTTLDSYEKLIIDLKDI